MNQNITSWMIGAGVRLDQPSNERELQLLRAIRETRQDDRSSLAARARAVLADLRPWRPQSAPNCCPA